MLLFGLTGFVRFPIVTFAYRQAYLEGQHIGTGLVVQQGLPMHSVRGHSHCKPLRLTQSHVVIKILPFNSRLLQRLRTH